MNKTKRARLGAAASAGNSDGAAKKSEPGNGEAGVDFGSGVVTVAAVVVMAGKRVPVGIKASGVGKRAGGQGKRKCKERVLQEFGHVLSFQCRFS